MRAWWLGALLGGLAAAGVLMAIRASPPMRQQRLADRIAPYLADTPAPSRLLSAQVNQTAPFNAIRKLLGPAILLCIGWLDQVFGGAESVRRRLGGLGARTTVEEFRVEQILWGAAGMCAGTAVVAVMTISRGGLDPVLTGGAGLLAGVGGVLGRDWRLSRQVARREHAMLAEFPIVADLLALAVLAGEAPIDAMQRVCRLTRGELTRDLQTALDDARAGLTMVAALSGLAARTTLESFSRFVEGIVVAIERGTPLADVLRSQAADVREQSKRALLEEGGRKELQMMVPVVFMILPITVLFALYPGLVTLVSMST